LIHAALQIYEKRICRQRPIMAHDGKISEYVEAASEWSQSRQIQYDWQDNLLFLHIAIIELAIAIFIE
jgi:hypothetical protein